MVIAHGSVSGQTHANRDNTYYESKSVKKTTPQNLEFVDEIKNFIDNKTN